MGPFRRGTRGGVRDSEEERADVEQKTTLRTLTTIEQCVHAASKGFHKQYDDDEGLLSAPCYSS